MNLKFGSRAERWNKAEDTEDFFGCGGAGSSVHTYRAPPPTLIVLPGLRHLEMLEAGLGTELREKASSLCRAQSAAGPDEQR